MGPRVHLPHAERREGNVDDTVTRRELVRPDREPPELRFGPGVRAAELSQVVAALERI